jgi:hypothetical protein
MKDVITINTGDTDTTLVDAESMTIMDPASGQKRKRLPIWKVNLKTFNPKSSISKIGSLP